MRARWWCTLQYLATVGRATSMAGELPYQAWYSSGLNRLMSQVHVYRLVLPVPYSNMSTSTKYKYSNATWNAILYL